MPLLVALLALLALPFVSLPSRAQNFIVDTTADAPDAAIDGTCADAQGRCTLRAAVQESNEEPSLHRIDVPAGKYRLTVVGAGEDAAATGDLDVTGSINLVGEDIATTFIEGKKDRVFEVLEGGSATLNRVTLRKGKVGKKGDDGDESSGGAARNQGTLILSETVVTGNTAGNDCGGVASSGPLLVVQFSTVSRNKAGDDIGGVCNEGGGLDINKVTFSKNKARDEVGALESEQGGTLTARNVTVSGNKARENGGIHAELAGIVELTNVTITGNKAKEGAGGLGNEGAPGETGVIRVTNSLIGGNKPLNCAGEILSVDGGNVEQGTSCGFAGPADLGGVADLGLGKLADNGGASLTHALEAGSPAIDFGIDLACDKEDQRGEERFDDPSVDGNVCDAGAFEYQGE